MLHTIAFQEIRYLQNVEKLSEVLTKIDRRDLLYKLESREGEKHNLNPNSLIVPSPPVAPNVQVTPSVSVTPSVTVTPSVPVTPSVSVTPSVTVTPSVPVTASPPVITSVPGTPSVSVVPSAPIFARTRHNSFCVPESSFPLYLEIADQDIDEYHSV